MSYVAENLGRFLVQSIQARVVTWIDSNGKNRNSESCRGYFESEFPAIGNHCGIMMA